MTGTLADILEKGLWTGEKGENYLIATQSMIKADKLLFHGLGLQSELNLQAFEKEIKALGITLEKMGVNEFGIYIPVVKDRLEEYLDYLEISAKKLPEAFWGKHKEEQEYILKIVFSVDRDYLNNFDPVIEKIRNYFRPVTDVSVIIDKRNNMRMNVTKDPLQIEGVY